MSSPSGTADAGDMKGGHAPAVKVGGGVRITQHKNPHADEPKTKADIEDEKKLAQEATRDQRVVISGALAKGDKDFTTEAVKVFHEKPMTSNPPHYVAPQDHRVINQPRRNN